MTVLRVLALIAAIIFLAIAAGYAFDPKEEHAQRAFVIVLGLGLAAIFTWLGLR